jgi:ADP-ribose pyrophosphatase
VSAGPESAGADPATPVEIVTSRYVFDGRVFRVRVDEVLMSDGRVTTRDVIDHPGAVVIAAVDGSGRVAMVRQYRHAVGGELLELPAGTLEPGEPPAETAVRELREETGLSAAEWVPLGSFYSSPGFLHEELFAYLATGLTAGTQSFDDDEDIAVEWLPLADVLDDPGRVRDAKTLATLLLVARHQTRGRADS